MTFNQVRVSDMEYLGWAYRKIPWIKEQIDSDKRFYRVVEEHELLPHWHKRHVSRHYRKYSGKGADNVHDEDYDDAMFTDA